MIKINSIFKKVSIASFALFAAFLVYANLEPAPLHTYAPPAAMVIFKSTTLKDKEKAKQINDILEKINGITANSINLESQLISITYHPEKTNANSLKELLKNSSGLDFDFATYEKNETPQPECPIPHGVFANLEKIKYAFCFR